MVAHVGDLGELVRRRRQAGRQSPRRAKEVREPSGRGTHLVHVLGRDNLVLAARQEQDRQVGRQLLKLRAAVPLLVQQPREGRERRRERWDELGDARERVLEDERRRDRGVLGREVDGDGAADRLAEEDDGPLAEDRVVGDEVEGGLRVALKGEAARGRCTKVSGGCRRGANSRRRDGP